MQNVLLGIAGMGLLFTTLSGTLYDMTYQDCHVNNIEMACRELQK